jgi:acyl-CoA reductase-like NAD-dependent aldehyde dehydrogenase
MMEPTTRDQIDVCLAELSRAKHALHALTSEEKLTLLRSCIEGVWRVTDPWISAACKAKEIEPDSPTSGEEIAAGPMATLRSLRLLMRAVEDTARHGAPMLPGEARQRAGGQWAVPVFPTRAGLYDALLFAGFRAEVWIERGMPHPSRRAEGRERAGAGAGVALVLGAGNVNSIPATDMLGKVFQDGRAVLLKMNPVNDYLGPLFADAFADLIRLGFLRIVHGGSDVGAYAVSHDLVDEVHITGSAATHDAIVWGETAEERARRQARGEPQLHKPISSELGNVTPWIVVPGPYSPRELGFQAENVAAMVTNNASFNCVATRVIVTQKSWPQRVEFLDQLSRVLSTIPPRKAYYPRAAERFRGLVPQAQPVDSDRLPWMLLRDVHPAEQPQFFQEESFVGIVVETAMEAATQEEYLRRAVDFVNQQCWGTLGAGVMVHPRSRRGDADEARFQNFLSDLKYGTVGINHWPGLAFGTMCCPWGGYGGASLGDPQSGMGWVHNVFALEHIEKTVLEGPLCLWPKPLWFPTHRTAHRLARKVTELYHRPAWYRVPGIAATAMLA